MEEWHEWQAEGLSYAARLALSVLLFAVYLAIGLALYGLSGVVVRDPGDDGAAAGVPPNARFAFAIFRAGCTVCLGVIDGMMIGEFIGVGMADGASLFHSVIWGFVGFWVGVAGAIGYRLSGGPTRRA